MSDQLLGDRLHFAGRHALHVHLRERCKRSCAFAGRKEAGRRFAAPTTKGFGNPLPEVGMLSASPRLSFNLKGLAHDEIEAWRQSPAVVIHHSTAEDPTI